MSENSRQRRSRTPASRPTYTLVQQGPHALHVTLAILAAVILLSTGVGYTTIGRAVNTISGGVDIEQKAADGAMDVLVVGSDSRTDAQGRPLSREELDMLSAGTDSGENTDTLMVIRVPHDGTSATAVSIPRDTYVHDDQLGNLKINGVYAGYKMAEAARLAGSGLSDRDIEQRSTEAGRKGLVNAINELTGVGIDHYAEVGLLGFVLITDAVGGVEVCLNEAVYDEFSGANFPAGRQTLSGVEALSFVRQRHGLPRGDFDRIVRQQAFSASLVNKVLSTGTLSNPSKLNALSQAVQRSVAIDSDWEITAMANQLQNLVGGNVTFSTIPVTSANGIGDNGESIVTVDRSEVRKFMHSLLGEKDAPADSASDAPASEGPNLAAVRAAQITVRNGGNQSGLAARVEAHLSQSAIPVRETGNATPTQTSKIIAAAADSPAAVGLAQLLGGLPIIADPELASDEIVVILGADYSGPQASTAPEPEQTAVPTEVVGQEGSAIDPADASPALNAGGEGPRCIN